MYSELLTRPRPLTQISPALQVLPAPASLAAPHVSRLWLALELPQFPLQVALRGDPSPRACVMAAGEGTRQQVLFANTPAIRLGIRPGLPLGAVHALGEVLILPRDLLAEQRALEQLCLWAYQFSPLLSPVAGTGLVLEIQGSLKLFKGLDTLLQQMRRGLRDLGYRSYLAVAPNPAAATALARARRQGVVTTHEALPSALNELPIDVLALSPTKAQDLYSIGVRTLGECTRLPREGLGRRFAPQFLRELDQLYGRQPDLRLYFELPKSFNSRLELPWEIKHTPALQVAMTRLLHELTAYLRVHAATTRQLHWRLHQADGRSKHQVLGLGTPSREFARFSLLTRERFHREILHAPVRAIELTVESIEPEPAPDDPDLFTRPATALPEDWPQFVARLRARLGPRALHRLAPVPEHRPEHATHWREPLACPRAVADPKSKLVKDLIRPLWLTHRPIPLRGHEGKPEWGGALTLSAERERIQSGWWDKESVTRDYFVATDARGRRWWIYKDLGGERGWYLHGIFE